MEPLSLSDIGTPISLKKGWWDNSLSWREENRPIIIVTIRAPNGSVLAITDYKYPAIKIYKRKKTYYFDTHREEAIRVFMMRNRRDRTK